MVDYPYSRFIKRRNMKMFLTKDTMLIGMVVFGLVCFVIGYVVAYVIVSFRRYSIVEKSRKYLDEAKNIIARAEIMNNVYSFSGSAKAACITFLGNISDDKICAINTARFVREDNRVITIDRDSTVFYGRNGEYAMVWRNCYIWDGTNKIYLDPSTFNEKLPNLRFLEFEVDDDAPEDYTATVIDWKAM